MSDTTTNAAPAATTTTKTTTDNLPLATQAALAEMRKTLASPGTKLGLLARRVEAAVRDLHQAATDYGTTVVVRSALGKELRLPISTEVNICLTVSAAGEAPAIHQFVVGNVSPPGRLETPLESFPKATVVAQNAPTPTSTPQPPVVPPTTLVNHTGAARTIVI